MPTITPHEEARRAILVRHARLNRHGIPSLCHPPAKEIREASKGRTPEPKRRIIFDTVCAAQRCALDLRALDNRQHGVERCPRSRHGHVHLVRLDRP